MRVFVAGATGAIGRPLVRQLVAAGHEVAGTTRWQARAEIVRADGGEPVLMDALDLESVKRAVDAARPDAIVHQLTQIPPDLNPRTFAAQFETTNRLRSEGTRHLLVAADGVGVRKVVAQSIAFAYRPEGAGDKIEEDPLIGPDAPTEFRASAEAVEVLELAVRTANGIVLRYGYFYGPGTAYDPNTGSIAARVRKRGFPIVGDGGGVFSFIHVDDAAAATVAALVRGNPGVYNIVDDEPAPLRDWLPVYAETVGAPPPRRVPRWLARIAVGKYMTLSATSTRGASNLKARTELEWEPRYASWRDGFRAVAT